METKKGNLRVVSTCVNSYQVGVIRESEDGEKVFIVDACFFCKSDALEFVNRSDLKNYLILDYYSDCFIK